MKLDLRRMHPRAPMAILASRTPKIFIPHMKHDCLPTYLSDTVTTQEPFMLRSEDNPSLEFTNNGWQLGEFGYHYFSQSTRFLP